MNDSDWNDLGEALKLSPQAWMKCLGKVLGFFSSSLTEVVFRNTGFVVSLGTILMKWDTCRDLDEDQNLTTTVTNATLRESCDLESWWVIMTLITKLAGAKFCSCESDCRSEWRSKAGPGWWTLLGHGKGCSGFSNEEEMRGGVAEISWGCGCTERVVDNQLELRITFEREIYLWRERGGRES